MPLISSSTSTEKIITQTTAFSVRDKGRMAIAITLTTAANPIIRNEISSRSAIPRPLIAALRFFLTLRGWFACIYKEG